MRVLEIHSRVNIIEEVKEVADYFDVFYLMGVYEPTEYSKQLNREYALDGSLFAIENYDLKKRSIHTIKKLREFGKPIIIDLIPNHLGINGYNYRYGFKDKRWGNWVWADTIQLNYTSFLTLTHMQNSIKCLSSLVDGFRVDMAHLLLEKNYNSTHSVRLGYEPLQELINVAPKLIWVAEAYQDHSELISLGFNYVYNIEHRRGHNIDFTGGLVSDDLVVIDNHDEPMLRYMLRTPALRMFHLSKFKNTLWYLPAIMGYRERPSANYYNKTFNKDEEVKKIYMEKLREMR